jgi:hypothetical protein
MWPAADHEAFLVHQKGNQCWVAGRYQLTRGNRGTQPRDPDYQTLCRSDLGVEFQHRVMVHHGLVSRQSFDPCVEDNQLGDVALRLQLLKERAVPELPIRSLLRRVQIQDLIAV